MEINYWRTLILTVFWNAIQCCPGGFFRGDKETCLRIGNPSMSSMRDYCRGYGSKVFGRPLNEELSKNLAEQMVEKAKRWMPDRAFLGMYRRGEFASSENKHWKFEGEEDEFKAKDYKFWYESPEKHHCAVTGPDFNFLAKTSSCNDDCATICQKKDPPCYEDDVYYVEYKGLCLVVGLDKNTYDSSKEMCKNGHLMHLKKKQDVESLYLAFHNTRFAGGVYIGLNKTDDGEWVYENGEKQEGGWEPDNKNDFKCGAMRIIKDEKLGLYSVSCVKHKLHFLCERPYSDDSGGK